MDKILVVDDEPAIVTLLQYNLEQAQYSVTTAADGEEAVAKAMATDFQCILLDLMLPKLDGYGVTRRLREAGVHTPIIMLTAKDDEMDKIIGLELGADDYVTKPFSPREIIARIKAIGRRVAERPKSTVTDLHVGELSIDTVAHKAEIAGRKLDLTPTEFRLLACFAQNAGHTLSREQLLENVWGAEFSGNTRMVDIQISHLRDKLELDPKNPRYLQTIRGFGYQLEEPTDA
ncbi:response regulator transcription factor [Lacticaseibacillus hulanensis]|uniref:response regulator transcription factor n=1 Tax=Lacticaseibacillus hulanensis TaxID=2493111 RepID=UPI0013E2AF02|nr:response regulator transcription factor [Lacticaseibacillus hulanensis]